MATGRDIPVGERLPPRQRQQLGRGHPEAQVERRRHGSPRRLARGPRRPSGESVARVEARSAQVAAAAVATPRRSGCRRSRGRRCAGGGDRTRCSALEPSAIAAGGIERHDELAAHALAVEVLLELVEARRQLLGRVVGDVGVLLVAQPLDDVDVGLEGDAAGRPWSASSSAASSKRSGRMPTITWSRSPTASRISAGRSKVTNGQLQLARRSTRPGTKFIGGEPMKPATNMLTGCS